MMATLIKFIEDGGPVMVPLLGLSLIGVAICIERGWRLIGWNSARHRDRTRQISALLRRGEHTSALALCATYTDPDAALTRQLLAEPVRNEAAAIEALEMQEARLRRGFSFLATVIVAAPMLGVLGTVMGVIHSFKSLTQNAAANPNSAVKLGALSGGISEALVATATGIGVALIILFPYNVLRGISERISGRLEGLAASVISQK